MAHSRAHHSSLAEPTLLSLHPARAPRMAGSRKMCSGRTPSEDVMGALGSGDGLLLYAGESTASQKHPCQEFMMLSRCSPFCSQRQRLTQ